MTGNNSKDRIRNLIHKTTGGIPMTILSIHDCNTIQNLESLVTHLQPKVGFLGGRKFSTGKNSYSLNTLIGKVESFISDFSKANQGSSHDDRTSIRHIRKKIETLNTEGDNLLASRNFFTRIFTSIRRLFGLSSFLRNRALKRVDQFLDDNSTRSTGKHNRRRHRSTGKAE